MPKIIQLAKDSKSKLGECQTLGRTKRPSITIALIAFLTEHVVVDRIINHLKLAFVGERPPQPRVSYQEVPEKTAASGQYF
jgi:hypothetical protein